MNFKMLILSISLLFILSCSDDSAEEKRFMKTYKEILVVRETVTDSVEANQKVGKVIEQNGYTQLTFRDKFFDLAKDKQRFTKMIDSVRKTILRDTTAFK